MLQGVGSNEPSGQAWPGGHGRHVSSCEVRGSGGGGGDGGSEGGGAEGGGEGGSGGGDVGGEGGEGGENGGQEGGGSEGRRSVEGKPTDLAEFIKVQRAVIIAVED